MWPHKKKSIGVSFGDLRGQAIGPPRPIQQSCHVSGGEMLILKSFVISNIAEAAATIRQQPGFFERTRYSMMRRCRLCVEVSGHMFEHLL